MTWTAELFPSGYWTEAQTLPALQAVAIYPGREWKVVRCFRNQEGGLTSRPIGDVGSAEATRALLATLERVLDFELSKREAAEPRLVVVAGGRS
ncbi:MAG TPA: hypothetical protein VKS60_20370 [Stellaceae bacterium]|nr:hypothetical protein [Stellaceae bacterium]